MAGFSPRSVHPAAQAAELPASISALYEKINHTEPELVRALVRGIAERLGAVAQALAAEPAGLVQGYRVGILDGNHLPGSEKRLEVLHEHRGAALPGQSLVVYDPEQDLVVDLLPCEDAYAQERALVEPLLSRAAPGELWAADRNFCTQAILSGWQARRCGFLVREHARIPNPRPLSEPRYVGRAKCTSSRSGSRRRRTGCGHCAESSCV